MEGQLDPDNVIQLSIKEQSISLYVVPGVPEDFPFKTKTRKEISVSGLSTAAKIIDLKTQSENLLVPIARSPYMEAQQNRAWQVLSHFAVHRVSLATLNGIHQSYIVLQDRSRLSFMTANPVTWPERGPSPIFPQSRRRLIHLVKRMARQSMTSRLWVTHKSLVPKLRPQSRKPRLLNTAPPACTSPLSIRPSIRARQILHGRPPTRKKVSIWRTSLAASNAPPPL